MKAVYKNCSILEREAKARFCFPDGIMMENAAAALECAVGKALPDAAEGGFVLVLCGGGNNGGDGLALARRLSGRVRCAVCLLERPKSAQSVQQEKMARAAGVEFFAADAAESFLAGGLKYSVIVDCIFGTGFHGVLDGLAARLVFLCNGMECAKIACDVPSGIDSSGKISSRDADGNPLAFRADVTVTMGALKAALFSDSAKSFCGEIVCAPLGVSRKMFESCSAPDAWLLEASDIHLPIRTQKSAHKGKFGHAAVSLGEKPGAGIIAGTAALCFGAGLATAVRGVPSAEDFAMSPELMCADDFPPEATAILLGSGLGRIGRESSSSNAREFIERKAISFLHSMKNPACVIDADLFYYGGLREILQTLDGRGDARVILTPHPKELHSLLDLCGVGSRTFSEVLEERLDAAMEFGMRFPNLVLVAKGANTFIVHGASTFIFDGGSAALAKAGSGDVLAGMCAGLLAQGYGAEMAAKTAVFAHGAAASTMRPNYALSPLSLCAALQNLDINSGFRRE